MRHFTPFVMWRTLAVHALAILLAIVVMTTTAAVQADDLLLLLQSTPGGELAIVHVDFSGAVARGDVKSAALGHVQAFDPKDGTPVKVQFVPEPITKKPARPAKSTPTKGTLVLKLPRKGLASLRLRFGDSSSKEAAATDTTKECVIELAGSTITHDAKRLGGLPSSILFRDSEKRFSQFAWNDRLHHKQQGGFLLRNDDQANVVVVSRGPICTVVRVTAAYKRPNGTQPASRPRAVYDWYYFHDQPVAMATVTVSQDSAYAWDEVHFLELNFPGDDFTHWLGGEPTEAGTLLGDGTSHRLSDWAAVVDKNDVIGLFGCGRALVHDGRGHYGTYLHADGDRCWESWSTTRCHFSAWLWIGSDDDPAGAIGKWRERLPVEVSSTVTTVDIHEQISAARHDVKGVTPEKRAAALWRAAVAGRLEANGDLRQAASALRGKVPANWTVLNAGDLRLAVQRSQSGIELASLFDTRANHEHLAPVSQSLFHITLRNADTKEQVTLDANRGWKTTFVRKANNNVARLRWQLPTNTALGDLTVVAQVISDPKQHALRWQLSVTNPKRPWSLWRVRFPQVEVVAPGDEPALLFPRGPGEVQNDVWRRTFAYKGVYPNGWTSMQFMAVYDRRSRCGLYWALHDPLASTKELSAKSQQPSATVVLSAEHSVPGMGELDNSFQLSGEAVWRLYSGDWYDAAQIYRGWVRQHARWYPKLGNEGREDTPLWMRELCAWAQTGGTAKQSVEQVQQFAKFLGVPVGYHWYRWHKIPFDNDYPHYFPATDGFREGVRALHNANVYVMPYINGRLWDTRDRGLEDFEFSRRALSATTKDDEGQPYTETYGSKESDGSSVRLAAMCPSTTLWRNEIHEIVNKLLEDCDVDGVYIDQIAASAPKTCMDPLHGHPLGGGHWWTAGYWKLLEQLRSTMAPDQMLTSECNAEPYLRWFDGYLTWHWQYDGQVPAFPAVYGGAIQMFGRAYRGGETRDLALRMKSAQQLVFGEQIGWINPAVIKQPENATFFRNVVRLRYQLRRYFYAGRMLRPPTLAGKIPRVRADWQWNKVWWVETDALLSGIWQLPQNDKLVAIFANVSDQPIDVTWSLDANGIGMDATQVTLTRITSEGPGETETASAAFKKPLSIPTRAVWAFEIKPK